jgi:hypothetical protein
MLENCHVGSFLETAMRGLILSFAGGLALAASAQAAPLALNPASIELGAAPSVELVRDGCGRGWHRTRWRDQWGYWQSGDCVPNEGGYGPGYGYDGRGAGVGVYVPFPDLRGVLPRWGWGY